MSARRCSANFDFGVIMPRAALICSIEGMTFTLTLTALAALGGLVFGTLIALMRLSGYKTLGRIAGLYVDLMRSLPLVLVIFWFYFLVPYIGQWVTGARGRSASARSLRRSSPSSCSRRRTSPRSCAPASSRSRTDRPAPPTALGLTYAPDHALRHPAAGIPQHAAGAADADRSSCSRTPRWSTCCSITDFLGAASARSRSATAGWSRCTCSLPSVYFVISCIASFGVRRLQARIAIIR